MAAKRNPSVETETGRATLRPDGSMLLNNSGYRQTLSPEMVQLVWNGATIIPYTERQLKEIREEYDEDDEMMEKIEREGRAFWDGDYWDFGEELHIIPELHDFPGHHHKDKLTS